MRLNLYYLIFTSFIYSYQCGSQLFPVIYDKSYEPFRNREEKCLNHSVGDIVSFYIDTDFNSSTPNEPVDFYLYNQHVEKEGCFYVEISNDIRDSDLDELWELFFESTPDSEFGYINSIKTSEELIFGPPPTINNISEVNILFYDFNSENIRGYFAGNDQLCDDNNYNCSNIIYVNADNQLQSDLDRSAFTLAHEYQHLLHWNIDPYEGNYITNTGEWYLSSPWLNEGLSDLAPYLLGLGQRDFSPYLADTYLSLDEWPLPSENVSNIDAYYAKSALFVEYLFDYFDQDGETIINLIFSDSQFQGLESIQNNLSLFDLDYESVYNSWVFSNIKDFGVSDNISLEDFYLENSINYNMFIEDFKKNSSYNILIPKISNYVIDSTYVEATNISSNLTQNGRGLFILVQEPNSFFVTLINYDRIFDTDVSISIKYKPSSIRLSVFPNPISVNNSQLFYEFDDSYRLPYEILENSSKIKIYDISGKLVDVYNDINSLSSSIFLNINNYHSGAYILSVDKYSEKFSIIK